jgi:hypothetical protein
LFVFSHDDNGDVHGIRRADMARAHARWQHLVALHEATDTLHWESASRRISPTAWLLQLPSILLHFITS